MEGVPTRKGYQCGLLSSMRMESLQRGNLILGVGAQQGKIATHMEQGKGSRKEGA